MKINLFIEIIIISILFPFIFSLDYQFSKNLVKDFYSLEKLEYSRINYIMECSKEKNQNMIVELSFTHPSKFNITFNENDNEEEISSFINNQSGLIISERKEFGKNIIILNPDISAEEVVLSISYKDKIDTDSDEYVLINYYYSESEKEQQSYYLNDTKLKVSKKDEIIGISWEPIKQSKNEEINDENFTVSYDIYLTDKKDLDSKTENVNTIIKPSEMNEITPLYYSSLIQKGKFSSNTNYIRLNITKENKNEIYINIIATASSIQSYDNNFYSQRLSYTPYILSEKKENNENNEEKKEDNTSNNNSDSGSSNLLLVIIIIIVVLLIAVLIVIIILKMKSRNVITKEDIEGLERIQ